MRVERLPIVAAALQALILAVPAHGACEVPYMVSSVFPPDGTPSYVYTPGVEPGAESSSIGDGLAGVFWALGLGDPASGQGVDSGTFAALDPEGWVERPLGYPAFLHTTWAASRAIDGCLSPAATPGVCMALLLSDQESGKGHFAFLTAAPIAGDFLFAQFEGAPIVLAALPRPQTSDVATFPSSIRTTVQVDAPLGGLYANAECPASPIVGYRVYAGSVAYGAPAPADLNRATGGWAPPAGGNGEPFVLGSSVELSFSCEPGDDVYLAASLVFDSGFETAHVSEASAPLRCD